MKSLTYSEIDHRLIVAKTSNKVHNHLRWLVSFKIQSNPETLIKALVKGYVAAKFGLKPYNKLETLTCYKYPLTKKEIKAILRKPDHNYPPFKIALVQPNKVVELSTSKEIDSVETVFWCYFDRNTSTLYTNHFLNT